MADEATEPTATLARARALFESGGAPALTAELASPGGAFWLQAVADEPAPDDEAAAAAQYELLALDALARERFGWASVCLSAATLRYSEADRTDDAAWATACDRRVRRECFPPFADDAERLEVVRGWARARAAELVTHAEAEADAALSGDAPEPTDDLADRALGLRLGWMLRQSANAERGRALPLDLTTSALGLEPTDALVLTVLAAATSDRTLLQLAESGPTLTAGLVIDMLAEREGDRQLLGQSLDSRAPLRRLGLVHITGEGDRPLRDCAAAVDEAVLAAIEGRDAWPGLLAGVARLSPATESPANRRHVAAIAELDFLTARPDVTAVALCGPSTADTREVAAAWAESALRPYVELRLATATPTPATWRALARELRLRGAVLYVQAAGDWANLPTLADTLSDLADTTALAGTTVLLDAPPDGDALLDRHIAGLAELRLATHNPEAIAELWNEALEREGVPPLPVPDLAEALGHLPLGPADIAHLARLATLRASLQTAPGRTTTVTIASLKRLATRVAG